MITGGTKQLFSLKHRANALLMVILILTSVTSVTLFNLTYLARQREINQQLVHEYQHQTRQNLNKAQANQAKPAGGTNN